MVDHFVQQNSIYVAGISEASQPRVAEMAVKSRTSHVSMGLIEDMSELKD